VGEGGLRGGREFPGYRGAMNGVGPAGAGRGEGGQLVVSEQSE
jgi:hypothetical protein